MRTITPPLRFQNFLVRTDDATPGQSNIQFLFPTDSLIAFVFAEVSFICPTATFATISINLGSQGSAGFGDNQQSTAIMKFAHANLHATVPSLTAQFQNTIQLDYMLVKASTTLNITRNTLQSAGQTSSVVGNVSVGFIPLSEWVNFREPGATVRL